MTSLGFAQGLEPPALIELAEVPRPEVEGALGEVRVRVRLSLDAEGAVVGVELVESAGAAFDAAAEEALLRSRFAPARRDGVGVPSVVGFEYVFAEVVVEEVPAGAEDHPAATGGRRYSASEGGGAVSDEGGGSVSDEGGGSVSDEGGEELDDEPVYEARATVWSRAEQRRRSVEAVDVVDLADARARSADLGEVLARSEAVTVQRSGGLGGAERVSLAGLEGKQLRFFLDGIPLRYMGFGLGLANVPVGLVDRVEIYRGVVPIRYGADAVGGAIDLVSDLGDPTSRGSLSYQVGSFGTHRVAASGQLHHARTGLFARGQGYFDHARNDYDVDVRVANSSGRIEEQSVALRNAAYRSYGLALEAGVAGRPRAKLASIRAFLTEHDKGVPHNIAMTVPYGEVRYGQADRGLLLRYDNDFRDERVSVSLAGGFVAHRVRFDDQAECAYDWYYQCAIVRPVPGEMSPGGRNLETLERSLFLRANLRAKLAEGHELAFSVSPELDLRSTERQSAASSTLTGQGTRRMLVAGADYRVTLAERLENSLFVKAYWQAVSADDRVFGEVITREVNASTFGLGDSLRLDLHEDLYLKASYEWATRIPTSDEYFGDGALTTYNYGLQPERSHNLNVSLHGRLERERLGLLRGELAFVGRFVRDLVWRSAVGDTYQNQNVGDARALGVTASASYRSPGEWAELRGNVSYLDFRNISSAGAYADVYGDRVPNRPYLEAAFEAGTGVGQVHKGLGRLSLRWGARYVHSYYLAYESRGASGSKLTVAPQLVMYASLRHGVSLGDGRTLTTAIDLQNLADAQVFDFYGVQRPGRAVYGKLSLDF